MCKIFIQIKMKFIRNDFGNKRHNLSVGRGRKCTAPYRPDGVWSPRGRRRQRRDGGAGRGPRRQASPLRSAHCARKQRNPQATPPLPKCEASPTPWHSRKERHFSLSRSDRQTHRNPALTQDTEQKNKHATNRVPIGDAGDVTWHRPRCSHH